MLEVVVEEYGGDINEMVVVVMMVWDVGNENLKLNKELRLYNKFVQKVV